MVELEEITDSEEKDSRNWGNTEGGQDYKHLEIQVWVWWDAEAMMGTRMGQSVNKDNEDYLGNSKYHWVNDVARTPNKR